MKSWLYGKKLAEIWASLTPRYLSAHEGCTCCDAATALSVRCSRARVSPTDE